MPYAAKSRKSRPQAQSPVEHAAQFALTPDEVAQLLGAVRSPRDLALLSVAVTTGIRREDLVAIPRSGYDGERLVFHESKKRRSRTVTLDRTAAANLDRYLYWRNGGEWLFPKREYGRSPHISGRTAWNVLNRWLEAVGLRPRPFHSLRGTAYKLAKARGWSVEMAAYLIGDSVRVAQEFYGVPTPGELAEAIRGRPLL